LTRLDAILHEGKKKKGPKSPNSIGKCEKKSSNLAGRSTSGRHRIVTSTEKKSYCGREEKEQSSHEVRKKKERGTS